MRRWRDMSNGLGLSLHHVFIWHTQTHTDNILQQYRPTDYQQVWVEADRQNETGAVYSLPIIRCLCKPLKNGWESLQDKSSEKHHHLKLLFNCLCRGSEGFWAEWTPCWNDDNQASDLCHRTWACENMRLERRCSTFNGYHVLHCRPPETPPW